MIRLNRSILINDMKLEDESAEEKLPEASERQAQAAYSAEFSKGQIGVLVPGILPAETKMKYNQVLRIPLKYSLETKKASYDSDFISIHANPRLFEVATVSLPSIILAGEGRIHPLITIQAKKEFDLIDFPYLATYHLN